MKKTLLFLLLAFLSAGTFAQSPLYRFDFDGSMDNSGSSSNFSGWTPTGPGSVAYVADRNGVANKAINLPNTINFVAACADLPNGNNARSLSFWVKFINDTDIDTYPVVGWGNNSANQAFGFWRNGPQNSYYTWGTGNDYNVPLTSAQAQTINNGWVHVGMTHNGSQMAIFLNGVAMGPFNRTLNTTGTNLYLNRLVNATGGSGSGIYLDDLKIYNTALTAAQMQTLYNPNANVSLPSVLSASSSASPTQDSDVITFVVNPGGAQTTTNILVTAFGGGISAVYTGPVFSGNEPTQATYTLTGLAPGTCYSYSIEAINSAGMVTTSGSRAFCTLDANNNSTPVYHFEFNGNRQEKNDPSIEFTNPNPLGFADNDTALRLDNNVQALNLPFLPQGAARRTVVIRVQILQPTVVNDVFSYGSAVNNQSYGYTQSTSNLGNNYFWGSNDLPFSHTPSSATYYTMAFVYDGLEARVYRDGNLLDFGPRTLATTGTMFRIGRTTSGLGGYFNGKIDDLRIYTTSLTATEIASISASLSTETLEKPMAFEMFPNPAHQQVTVSTEDGISRIEVFSLQGQKVLSSTLPQIDISSLAKGVYIVEVADAKQRKSFRKLVVE